MEIKQQLLEPGASLVCGGWESGGAGLSLPAGTGGLCSGGQHRGNASLFWKKANDISKRSDSAGRGPGNPSHLWYGGVDGVTPSLNSPLSF